MTRDEETTYRQAAANLLAFADGKSLLYANTHPVFSFLSNSISAIASCTIKPEPRLRPWTKAEIEAQCIKGTIIKGGPSKYVGPIWMREDTVFVGHDNKCKSVDGAYLLDSYVIAATGAPCGVMEGE